jgi:hypothetical protein
MAEVSPSAKTFTPKQGQYLAYIHDMIAPLNHFLMLSTLSM